MRALRCRGVSVIRSIGSRWQADVLLAVALTVAGLVEVLIAPAPDGSRLVSAIALSLATLPLAVRRAAPLVPLAALAVVWPVQAAFDGFLVGDIVTPIAPVVAIYSAGRHVSSTRTLAWAGAAVGA